MSDQIFDFPPSFTPPMMALHAIDDDEQLFTRAMTSYREAFLVRHAHLPETQRHLLWRQQLNQFIPSFEGESSSAPSLPLSGHVSGKSGKRSRQDVTPRTLPSTETASASACGRDRDPGSAGSGSGSGSVAGSSSGSGSGSGSSSGSGSGPPKAKRRATVRVTLVTCSQLPSFCNISTTFNTISVSLL